ncbi:dermonecrotic toxin LcsSicTox-betaIC1-like [Uloborus diversus]|uniref:dermonecrotic toxin LcsSicTox-betaIC1-like n=1 Tax=Uloborus diversus TaxID=327109 RepID=UPI002408F5BF|nr:dermonecrotic toxin LcsSicTox-betaIC1-like [Uloborus diversus]
MSRFITSTVLAMMVLMPFTSAKKRPFYIIGHMVNSIEEVTHYLDLGANAIEADIQFHPNGSVKEVNHGFPCDCFRTCTRSANVGDYLKYIRHITDPSLPGNYATRMVLQFLDLKMNTSNNPRISGRDIARHVLDYLWSKDGSREHEVKLLLYIDSTKYRDAFAGFLEEFKNRREEARLTDVGFDGGTGHFYDIRRMFASLKVKGNIWQGDGIANCVSPLYSTRRLRNALSIRDSKSSFISKVYHWNIDLKLQMKNSLNLTVDGMITNVPKSLREVLEEPYYKNKYRLGSLDDDPFARFNEK